MHIADTGSKQREAEAARPVVALPEQIEYFNVLPIELIWFPRHTHTHTEIEIERGRQIIIVIKII